MRKFRIPGLHVLIHVAALVPLMLLAWDFAQGQLTANPIREVQLRTGRYTLTLLVLVLACSPIYRLSGFKQALYLRRILGLYAFGYASLHFINFIAIDYGFNFVLLREDIFDKRYALVGFAAYLTLLPLAITSTKGWRERLGKNWKRLHRLVYLTAVLGVLHLFWAAKADLGLPIIYGMVVVFLLLLRIPVIWEALCKKKMSRS